MGQCRDSCMGLSEMIYRKGREGRKEGSTVAAAFAVSVLLRNSGV
jgi:hypothetical protein